MLARLFRAEEPSVYAQVPWEDLPDDSLPPPPLREGLGEAHLEVSTREPLAQAYFDQGLRLLHLGWGQEARRAFAEAARRDPALAMAWWGLALTRGPGPRFAQARSEAIGRALALSEGAKDLEQRLIVSASQLADRGPSNGRHAFMREMEFLIDLHPEAPEPRLLLAGFLLDGYESDGRPGPGQPYGQSLLRDLLRTHPRHVGVHLAWVRAWLPSSRPEVALDSARALTELAPGASPALLTAGQLLQRLGLHDEAHRALETAVTVDDAYLAGEALPAGAAPSAEPALRLLSLGHAEAGQYGHAQSWARRLRHRVAAAAGARPQAGLFAALTLVGVHLRFGFTRAAADVPVVLGEGATVAETGLARAARLYTRGTCALESGRLGDAEHACDALDALHPELTEERRAEGRLLCPRDVARMVEVAAQELRGALEARRGDVGRAEATLTHAVRLERRLRPAGPPALSRSARETLARVRLRSGREDKALALALSLAEERPGCGHFRLLVAEVRAAQDALPEAMRDFAAFLECWRGADAHLPELRRARTFLAGGGHPLRLVRPEPASTASLDVAAKDEVRAEHNPFASNLSRG